ncbi:MAG: leucine--tRNA ligase [Patescibacteria group bacterium]
MKKYDPSSIEKKWQKYWETKKLFITEDHVEGKENFYKLVEFPYPSGNLHMGHWYSYSVPDMYARYKKMCGYNVLFPFGYDAFGLPAENAAIKNNVQPAEWTKKNIKVMTKQMQSMGAMFDWSRMVSTIDPDYYRWTQWIFLQFYKAGLAYRAKTLVNWCPKDKTVLANEQVVDGKCDRCGSIVEQREREQWMYRVTKYAQQLLDGLEKVDWPKTTRIAQQNWIGRSEGVLYQEKIKGLGIKIEAFDSVPQTYMAQTFAVIAPEHPLVEKLITGTEHEKPVMDFIADIRRKKVENKFEYRNEISGIFTGRYIENPFGTGDLPIWVASFAIMEYGTGIVNCSAHDERDFAFAKKYNIPLRPVMVPSNEEQAKRILNLEECYHHDLEAVVLEPLEFKGRKWGGLREEIINFLEQKGLAKRRIQYRLRDWILSRQRYWGTPIPMITCEDCGYVPVKEEDLPIKLPKLENYLPADDGSSPLARAEKWVKVKCPQCGGAAKRETDTMDTFVDSSWYFLRYTDPENKKEFASKEAMKKWLPVDVYTGGAEHNTMHLLYSRFFIKALHELGLVDFDEPFKMRRNHGIVLGPDGQKMSKSKGNVIDPDKEVAEYGADTVRMFLAFLGPYDTFNGPWDPRAINGVYRFLSRVWMIAQNKNVNLKDQNEQRLHQAIKKVGEDIEKLHFNTAISELMKLLNEREVVDEVFLKLLAPFAPHLSEEIWHNVLGKKTSIHLESWPVYDPALIKEDMAMIAIQVNGKTRAVIQLPTESDEQTVRAAAEADEHVARHLSGPIKKVIFVKGKLCNLVL